MQEKHELFVHFFPAPHFIFNMPLNRDDPSA